MLKALNGIKPATALMLLSKCSYTILTFLTCEALRLTACYVDSWFPPEYVIQMLTNMTWASWSTFFRKTLSSFTWVKSLAFNDNHIKLHHILWKIVIKSTMVHTLGWEVMQRVKITYVFYLYFNTERSSRYSDAMCFFNTCLYSLML